MGRNDTKDRSYPGSLIESADEAGNTFTFCHLDIFKHVRRAFCRFLNEDLFMNRRTSQ